MLVVNAWHPDLLAEVKLGSMERALPGFTVEILRSDADEITLTGEVGRVAVDLPNSLLTTFPGRRDAPERSAARFSADKRWYLTGTSLPRTPASR
jgi:acetyl-CoA synthetase